MVIDKLYKEYCIDWNHNFNTFTLEEIKGFKENLTKEDIEKMALLLDEMFTYGLQSVTYDRPSFVSDLDIHQYFSMANYWWPNPDTKDGLPFIRRDGYVNPDSVKWCKQAVRKMGFTILNASLMYYFTDDKKYYELLKAQMNNFFINEETKMLPNIAHAQMVAGHPTDSKGRKTGIMDLSSNIGYALCAFKAIYDLGYVEEELYQNMKSWVKELIGWLTTATVAIEEKNETNNHGTMFALFMAQLYTFTGELDLYKEELTADLHRFLNHQVLEDGSMPEELERTRSLAYTTMNIKAYIDAFKLLDVKYYEVPLLKKSFEFILPVLNKEKDISDIKIIDLVTKEERGCLQIEGTYLESYKCYLKYVGHNFGFDVIVSNPEDVPYIYYLK